MNGRNANGLFAHSAWALVGRNLPRTHTYTALLVGTNSCHACHLHPTANI